MNKPKPLFGFLFGTSLFFGILIGIYIKGGIEATQQATQTASVPISQQMDHSTILFVGVPDFSSIEIRLESAWLASQEISQENNITNLNITLIPLYPITPSMVSSAALAPYAKAHQPLTFNPDNLDTLYNLPPIVHAKLSWEQTQIIILDETFMSSAILLSDPNNTSSLNPPAENLFKKPWVDPASAYQQQYGILTNLCHHPDNYFKYSNTANPLLELYAEHIRSPLTALDLENMWQIIVNLGEIQVNCDIFPKP